MKTITALLITVSASAALAGTWGPETPWEKIFKTKQLILLMDENLGGIELSNACLTDTEIRTIKDMRYCPKLVKVKKGENKDTWNDWVCEQWVVGPYSYPRTTTQDACFEWTRTANQGEVCTDKRVVSVTVGETINVRVSKGYGTTSTYPGFQKQYTFPDCH